MNWYPFVSRHPDLDDPLIIMTVIMTQLLLCNLINMNS